MKLLTYSFLFFLTMGCEKTVNRRPYKPRTCVKERSRFVASYSPEAYETYQLRSIVRDGYYTYRYDLKGKPMFYRWMSFTNVRSRDFTKVVCPDKKPIKLFVK